MTWTIWIETIRLRFRAGTHAVWGSSGELQKGILCWQRNGLSNLSPRDWVFILNNMTDDQGHPTIFMLNNIKSIVVTRMQVPCCGGLVRMVQAAMERSGKAIPCEVYTISNSGQILNKETI